MSHTHIMISHLVSFSLHPFLFPHHLCRNANLNHLKQPFRCKCGWHVSKLWMVKIRCAMLHSIFFFQKETKDLEFKLFFTCFVHGKISITLNQEEKQHRQKSSTLCIMDLALVLINRLRFSRTVFCCCCSLMNEPLAFISLKAVMLNGPIHLYHLNFTFEESHDVNHSHLNAFGTWVNGWPKTKWCYGSFRSFV